MTREQIVSNLRDIHFSETDAAADLIESDGAALADDKAIFAAMDAKILRLEALLADALAGLEPAVNLARAVDASMADDYELTSILTAGQLRAARAAAHRIRDTLAAPRPTPGGNHD